MNDVDHLLVPAPEPAVPAGSRDAVFRQTVTVLRRRRWLRRGSWVVALAACYGAGLGTSLLLRPAADRPAAAEIAERLAPPPKRAEAAPDPYRNDSPERIERWAGLARGEKQMALLRRAGDAFLAKGDQLGAIRCYRRALDAGSPEVLVFREDDTWLFMSLKLARQREKNDARN